MTDTKIRLMQITHDLAIGGLQRVVANICRDHRPGRLRRPGAVLEGPWAVRGRHRAPRHQGHADPANRPDRLLLLPQGRARPAGGADRRDPHAQYSAVRGRHAGSADVRRPDHRPHRPRPRIPRQAPIHGSRAGHVAVCLPRGRRLGPYVRQPREVREDRDGEDRDDSKRHRRLRVRRPGRSRGEAPRAWDSGRRDGPGHRRPPVGTEGHHLPAPGPAGDRRPRSRARCWSWQAKARWNRI